MKVKLGDKVGMIPDNFIEIKKETAKVPTPPLPSREETNPPAATKPLLPKENDVCVCVYVCLCVYVWWVMLFSELMIPARYSIYMYTP